MIQDKDILFTYYNIRERLAMMELCKCYSGLTISECSSIEGYNGWDVILNGDLITEIKLRNQSSTLYSDDLIFEQKKYNELMAIHDNPELLITSRVEPYQYLQPRFMVFFRDCVAIWDITQVSIDGFFLKSMSNKSLIPENEKKKVMKSIQYLRLKDASIRPFILNLEFINKKAKEIFRKRYPEHIPLFEIKLKQDNRLQE